MMPHDRLMNATRTRSRYPKNDIRKNSVIVSTSRKKYSDTRFVLRIVPMKPTGKNGKR